MKIMHRIISWEAEQILEKVSNKFLTKKEKSINEQTLMRKSETLKVSRAWSDHPPLYVRPNKKVVFINVFNK